MLRANPDKIVVIKFFAPWCRACKGLAPKFLAVKNDERYKTLPLVFADLNVQNNKDYVKALGILALPNVHIYAGSDGLVENFPCGPSKVPILKKKIANVVNDRVNPDTLKLMIRSLDGSAEEVGSESEPCRERDVTSQIGDVIVTKERIESLRKVPFFKDFNKDEFDTLMTKAKLQTFEPGNVIMKQGMEGKKFYVIDSGQVEISIKTDYEDPLIATNGGYLGTVINILSKDDYFGERALITSEPRAASIRAVEKTRCFAFNQEDIPESSVLSGKKSASEERIQVVNDKYGVSTVEVVNKGLDKQMNSTIFASQTRGSANDKSTSRYNNVDEKEAVIISEDTSSREDASTEYFLPKEDIITLLVRFRNIRRAARCFEYISKTQPTFGDLGEIKRRSLLVKMLTPSQIDDFKAAFEVIDKSRDNMVSLQEMRSFMHTVGTDKTDEELMEMINKANPMVDGNTEITYDEFMGVMAEAEFFSLFNDTFNALDKHNSGFIKAGEIDSILSGMRDLISDDRNSLIDVEDKDMLINYEQFSKMLLGIPSL